MPDQYLPVSWNEYHKLAQSLAAKILADKKTIDEIVAISRGGLTLGHLLTDFLRIPISTITIQSYTDIQTQGELTITTSVQVPIKGKNILLVDDVADTGKTLERALDHLKDFSPKSIITATLFYKSHSIYKPHYFSQETEQWILFPYEPTEMVALISKQLAKEGKSIDTIDQFLKNLGYTTEQIAFVKAHYP